MAPPRTLHLTPIERFWMAEETCDSYLSFFHKFELNSPVEQERLEQATRQVAELHPLPFCRLNERADGQFEWVDERHKMDPASRTYRRSPEPYPDTDSIDPADVCGIKIWYSDSTIWFQYHHVCADGRGALELERCFFEFYRKSTAPAGVATNQAAMLDARTYSYRSRKSIGPVGAFIRSTYGFWFLWRSMNASIVPLGKVTSTSATRTRLRCKTRRLTESSTTQLLLRSRKFGHYVNDLIMSATLTSIHDQLKQQGKSPATGNEYRVVVPIDMREAQDCTRACANKMSLLFFDIAPKAVEDRPALLRCITRRMKFLKRYMGLVMWRSISFGPKRITKLRTYFHETAMSLTCYVSNLGRIVDLPDEITGFNATPTLQHGGSPLGLMAYTFRGRLHLTAGYDALSLDGSTVDSLLHSIQGSLEEQSLIYLAADTDANSLITDVSNGSCGTER